MRGMIDKMMEFRTHREWCGVIESNGLAGRSKCNKCGREWNWTDKEWEELKRLTIPLINEVCGNERLVVWNEED